MVLGYINVLRLWSFKVHRIKHVAQNKPNAGLSNNSKFTSRDYSTIFHSVFYSNEYVISAHQKNLKLDFIHEKSTNHIPHLVSRSKLVSAQKSFTLTWLLYELIYTWLDFTIDGFAK